MHFQLQLWSTFFGGKVNVLNLFDRKYNDIEYYYATQLAGEAAPVNDKVVHAGEQRTARLTLRMAF
jgi:hypothetical protein